MGSGDRVDVVTLGERAPQIPSVICLRADGEVLVGEAAERRALVEPTRTAREFKRRLGDPSPVLLGGTPYGAEALMAILLRWVVDRVTAERGRRPDRIVVAHPANYGQYKLDLVREAVRLAEFGDAELVTEPAAAAIHYVGRDGTVEAGRAVAVYDFGGGTFDATVLRRDATGFSLVGNPDGLARLGGIDFDQAVFAFVEEAVGGAIAELDTADPGARQALARLREECQAAKEALSSDTDAHIPVLLPNLTTEVRITRGEFEALVRPRVAETVRALERAIESAGLAPGELAKVLLVGGSSRIPLCAQLVQEATGVPVAMDAQPKFAVCLGAAASGLRAAAPAAPAPVFAEPEPVPESPVVDPARPSWTTVEDVAAVDPTAPPPIPRFYVPPPEAVPTPPPPPVPSAFPPAPAPTAAPVRTAANRGSSKRTLYVVGGVLLLAAVAAGAVVALGGGDDSLVERFATANLGNGQCQAAFEFADGWQERVDNVTIISDNTVVASGAPDFEGEFVYPETIDLDAILLEDDRGDVVETATPDPDDC